MYCMWNSYEAFEIGLFFLSFFSLRLLQFCFHWKLSSTVGSVAVKQRVGDVLINIGMVQTVLLLW